MNMKSYVNNFKFKFFFTENSIMNKKKIHHNKHIKRDAVQRKVVLFSTYKDIVSCFFEQEVPCLLLALDPTSHPIGTQCGKI